jgi:hypothetical protein
MDINGFSPHIFWSYNKSADLEPGLIIKQVIAYGEINDMLLLSEKFNKEKILIAINNWQERAKYEKRIHFIKKVILD